MYQTFEELRSQVNKVAETQIKSVLDETSRRVEGISKWGLLQVGRCHQITENYIERGYHSYANVDYGFGDYRRGTAYIRELAREMRRQLVVVNDYTYQVNIWVPRTRAFAHVIAKWTLAADSTDTYPMFDQDRKERHAIHVFRQSKNVRLMVTRHYTNQTSAAENPLVTWTMDMLHNDPAIRRAIGVPAR